MRSLRSALQPAIRQSTARSLGLLALASGLTLGVGIVPGDVGAAAWAQAPSNTKSLPALSVEQARAAANRILEAVKKGTPTCGTASFPRNSRR